MLHRTHIDVWMRDLDNIKTNTRQVRGDGNVVPTKNDENIWTAKKSNDTVLNETKTKRALINKTRKRQATFFGHIMRRERQEYLVTTGMFMGRRGRGRLREKSTDRLVSWLGVGSTVEMIKMTREHDVWRGIIANAMRHGTG
ncbi:eukaryotic translation initiation factor 3 subunit F [Elysia marginata]|uniref:Eukaryotic translation initiation factor 3 subunit F n=1 Tax=Elysia marginata TaxID=1093978 RepID=A0AAV4FPA0_9GAST|nr:eukaryotic translation initiation factor 3 subunit F [Elysia marginata]